MDGRLHADLMRRVERATRSARATVEDAQVLVATSSAMRTRTLTTQCAWCGRYLVGERWVSSERMPRVARNPETGIGASHTICPDCIDELRQSGRSV